MRAHASSRESGGGSSTSRASASGHAVLTVSAGTAPCSAHSSVRAKGPARKRGSRTGDGRGSASTRSRARAPASASTVPSGTPPVQALCCSKNDTATRCSGGTSSSAAAWRAMHVGTPARHASTTTRPSASMLEVEKNPRRSMDAKNARTASSDRPWPW